MMSKKSKKQKAEKAQQEELADSAENVTPQENEVSEKAEKSPEEEIAELRDRLQRTTAEFMNFRKQTEKRTKDSRLWIRRDVFEQVLPIVDNFGAAMMALDQGQDAKNVLIGVKMIHEMLEKLLQDNGIKPIQSLNEPFDPNFHEAVSQEEQADAAPNTILKEVGRGYTMGEMVLRHARVVVAKAPGEDQDAADNEPQDDGDEDHSAS